MSPAVPLGGASGTRIPFRGLCLDGSGWLLAACAITKSPADHCRARVALVERRHVDLCRQSSALCR
ncbi:putative leader peptide [Streptomyces longwoodensis]|uniref:putative leader peptide n=1 Tax=Streptomyces longwoodensis TaxID=68231 RepID=UPI0038245D6F